MRDISVNRTRQFNSMNIPFYISWRHGGPSIFSRVHWCGGGDLVMVVRKLKLEESQGRQESRGRSRLMASCSPLPSIPFFFLPYPVAPS